MFLFSILVIGKKLTLTLDNGQLTLTVYMRSWFSFLPSVTCQGLTSAFFVVVCLFLEDLQLGVSTQLHIGLSVKCP